MPEKLTSRTFCGATKAVITPPVGYPMGNWGLRQGKAKGVHREMHVRSVVLKHEQTVMAVISLELAGLPAQTVQDIKTKILTLTGIHADSVLLNFTHNHTSPDTIFSLPEQWTVWAAWLADQIAGCVSAALHRSVPANIGTANGSFPGWTVNRQYPERSVDTEIGVMCIEDDHGSPIAHLLNFACHGVADGGQYLEWSADFAGEASKEIERVMENSIALYIQGAAGDIHPFDWWFGNRASEHLHSHEDTEAMGKALATATVRLANTVTTSSNIPLGYVTDDIELPRHQVSWSVSEALEHRENLISTLGNYSGDTWLPGTTTANAAENHPELYGCGNNEVNLAKNQNLPPVPLTVRGFRIGETSISAHAGELFNELGSKIKKAFPENRPWVASYCDHYIGYISSRKPYEEIANIPLTEIVNMDKYRRYYGTTTSPYSQDAGDILVDSAVKVLKKL